MMIDIDSDMLLSSALNVFKFQLHPYLVTFITFTLSSTIVHYYFEMNRRHRDQGGLFNTGVSC